jgi:hypothetical protein
VASDAVHVKLSSSVSRLGVAEQGPLLLASLCYGQATQCTRCPYTLSTDEESPLGGPTAERNCGPSTIDGRSSRKTPECEHTSRTYERVSVLHVLYPLRSVREIGM